MSKNPKEQGGAFFVLPRHLYHLPGMTLARLMVYECFFQFWHNDNEVWLSNKQIMERCNIKSHSTLSEIYQYLETNNLIQRDERAEGRYFIQPVCDKGVSVDREGGSRSTEGGGLGRPRPNNKDLISKDLNIYTTPAIDQNLLNKEQLLTANPFSLPEKAIDDFIYERKRRNNPITHTAWECVLTELQKCEDNDVNPIEVFNKFVANGWPYINSDFFIASKQKTKKMNQTSHFDNHSGKWAENIHLDMFP